MSSLEKHLRSTGSKLTLSLVSTHPVPSPALGMGTGDRAHPVSLSPEGLQLRLTDDHRGAVPDLRQDGILQGMGVLGWAPTTCQAPSAPPGTHHPVSPQGNLVAVKHLNRKRIELTRKVLFELKHVGGPWLGAAWWDGGAQRGVSWVGWKVT